VLGWVHLEDLQPHGESTLACSSEQIAHEPRADAAVLKFGQHGDASQLGVIAVQANADVACVHAADLDDLVRGRIRLLKEARALLIVIPNTEGLFDVAGQGLAQSAEEEFEIVRGPSAERDLVNRSPLPCAAQWSSGTMRRPFGLA
jgi:hypothetical protein